MRASGHNRGTAPRSRLHRTVPLISQSPSRSIYAVNDEVDLPLADVLRALRRELLEAMDEGAGSELRFAVGAVELEVQVRVGRERSAGGGIRFWVVSGSGKAQQESSTAHTVRLTLTPVTRGGEDVLLGPRTPSIPN